MTTKRHDDCFVVKVSGGVVHGTRNRQSEYKAKKRKNVDTLEAYCGRKKEVEKGYKVKSRITCQGCIKAMAAEARRA